MSDPTFAPHPGFYAPADRIANWIHDPVCMLRGTADNRTCTCRLTILNSLALLTDSDLGEPLAILSQVLSEAAAHQIGDFYHLVRSGYKVEIAIGSGPDPRDSVALICQRCHGEHATFIDPGTSLLEAVQRAIEHTKDVHRD